MNIEFVDILGVPFADVTVSETARIVYSQIEGDIEKPFIIFTPNPEIVMSAQKDERLMECLRKADLLTPDGVGIVWASRFFGKKIRERASGYDIVMEIFRLSVSRGGLNAFFFGGSEDSVSKAKQTMERKYKGLNVTGYRNGFFDRKDKADIVNAINYSKADLLLVGLGSPKQEKWIRDNMYKLGARVIIGVGGSFDVMSGNIARAPKIMQKLGIEWMYRLFKQPSRLFRMMRLPQFVFTVLFGGRRRNV